MGYGILVEVVEMGQTKDERSEVYYRCVWGLSEEEERNRGGAEQNFLGDWTLQKF